LNYPEIKIVASLKKKLKKIFSVQHIILSSCHATR
jgi:hypothetical protein